MHGCALEQVGCDRWTRSDQKSCGERYKCLQEIIPSIIRELIQSIDDYVDSVE